MIETIILASLALGVLLGALSRDNDSIVTGAWWRFTDSWYWEDFHDDEP